MRIPIRGINQVRKTLKDGTVRVYWYAWKGGPALPGQPGDPEFISAYFEAVNKRATTSTGELSEILTAYQKSQKFSELSPRTKRDYLRHIRKIEAEYGSFPVEALADRRARGDFLSWRDRLAVSSRRQADYTYSVLALIIAWAFDRGMVPSNPCGNAGRVYRSQRIDKIWTDEDEKRFMSNAPEHIGLAFMFALWTGQRQGDLLQLPWTAYDGKKIRLQQNKTSARVEIPLGEPLRALLDRTPRVTETILSTSRNTPWTASGFRASWRKACKKADVNNLTFHDLRGTAVTRLAIANCSVPEIAATTGHRLSQVTAILDAHYLSRESALGRSVVHKLETYANRGILPTDVPTAETSRESCEVIESVGSGRGT